MLIITALYVLGLGLLLATFLPFSPMTIDLVNLGRDAQLAIYRWRRPLWIAAGAAWVAALLLGAGGHGEPALTGETVVVVVAVTVVVMGFMFWTGYVPVVMTPPGSAERLSNEAASSRIDADSIILGVVVEGEARAYLRDQIARPHYFTDSVGDKRLVVSYCILCNSATAFEASLHGRPMDLRCVTAFNNNIIYFDRASGNYIQQLEATVIAGPDTGASLAGVPVVIARWDDWRKLYPHTTLYFAPPTALRDRMVALMLKWLIPVHKLARRDRPWHRIQGMLDPRRRAMEFVIGVEIQQDAVAYPVEVAHRRGIIEDQVGGTPLVVFADRRADVVAVFDRRVGSRLLSFEAGTGGGQIARDRETGSQWSINGEAQDGPLRGSRLAAVPHFNKLFWFSWALFKPSGRLHT